ncbi:cellulase family glycosylhydrolase [candidate division KSB1 bacterium]|nr:cellulase family glycosylhydrolase [candidate division KSB1 bacterium]
MKTTISILIIIFELISFQTATNAEAPFTRGINLTGWLQVDGPRDIRFTKYTRLDLEQIKSLGCDVIRLPINLHFMTSGAPNYTIDPLFYFFLDQIVDWAEELQIHLILDNHTFDPAEDTDPDIGDILIPVWTQMATHYKDRSTYVYYEILNEPHSIDDTVWNAIQQEVIDAIRLVDQKHTIIIGPAGWNSYNNLRYMPEYTDENLIYTFHFYDPFLFTHQGASWTDPSMEPLAGVPFPYNSAQMPVFPSALAGIWIQSSFNNYHNDGTVARVKQLLDIAANFQAERNVPMFCGEFGVYIPNSDNDQRVNWYGIVREYLEEKGLAWTIWDYQGGFGLFEKGSAELFDYDLNIPLVEALGLNPPDQFEFVISPDSTGIDLYRDYVQPGIQDASWANGWMLDYYSETNPEKGTFCIYWTGANQYNSIVFDFNPNRDLSYLVSQGYALDFWVRGDTPGQLFDMRFIDTKTNDPNDHPWRMRVTIDNARAAWDNAWHHLHIPLANFMEHGSWDVDTWYNPQGDFDWSAIDRLEIVAEHGALGNAQFWFDDIRIVDANSTTVARQPMATPAAFALEQNYPNPFNPATTIRFHLVHTDHVDFTIYNLAGQKVRTLISGTVSSGNHSVDWNGVDESGQQVAGGVYVYRMVVGETVDVKKMVLVY